MRQLFVCQIRFLPLDQLFLIKRVCEKKESCMLCLWELFWFSLGLTSRKPKNAQTHVTTRSQMYGHTRLSQPQGRCGIDIWRLRGDVLLVYGTTRIKQQSYHEESAKNIMSIDMWVMQKSSGIQRPSKKKTQIKSLVWDTLERDIFLHTF